jgi:hypothetical protein
VSDAATPALRVELTKRADGGAVLRCVRADGTVTWQRQEGKQAAFFPLHDLTHYAVETALGYRRGFLGLVADGWEIEDTTGKGARGALPDEAILVERLVGLLDVERATRGTWTAAEFVEQLAAVGVEARDGAGRPLDDDALARVRSRRGELLARWHALAPGAVLALPFHRPAPPR